MQTRYRYLLVVIWLLIIFIFSNEVSHTSSARSDAIAGVLATTLHVNFSQSVLTFLTRKAAHIFMYFVLGILMFNAVKDSKISKAHAILLSILLSLAAATFDEAHQLFVAGRSSEVRDIIMDNLASSGGVGLYYLLQVKHKNRKNSNISV